MPHKLIPLRRLYSRQAKRAQRHPGHRQVYVDNGCMCQGVLEDGQICGSVEGLEYHELFKENKPRNGGNNQFTIRTTLCFSCHAALNYVDHTFSHRRFYSILAADMAWEVERAGSYAAWLLHWGLIDRYQPQTVVIPGKIRIEVIEE